MFRYLIPKENHWDEDNHPIYLPTASSVEISALKDDLEEIYDDCLRRGSEFSDLGMVVLGQWKEILAYEARKEIDGTLRA